MPTLKNKDTPNISLSEAIEISKLKWKNVILGKSHFYSSCGFCQRWLFTYGTESEKACMCLNCEVKNLCTELNFLQEFLPNHEVARFILQKLDRLEKGTYDDNESFYEITGTLKSGKRFKTIKTANPTGFNIWRGTLWLRYPDGHRKVLKEYYNF